MVNVHGLSAAADALLADVLAYYISEKRPKCQRGISG
jgi:hypothetical protein